MNGVRKMNKELEIIGGSIHQIGREIDMSIKDAPNLEYVGGLMMSLQILMEGFQNYLYRELNAHEEE